MGFPPSSISYLSIQKEFSQYLITQSMASPPPCNRFSIFGQANSPSIRLTPARGSISHGLFYKDDSKISTCTLSSIPFLIPLILRERIGGLLNYSVFPLSLFNNHRKSLYTIIYEIIQISQEREFKFSQTRSPRISYQTPHSPGSSK